jgi:hypothetical protein
MKKESIFIPVDKVTLIHWDNIGFLGLVDISLIISTVLVATAKIERAIFKTIDGTIRIKIIIKKLINQNSAFIFPILE